MPNSMTRTDTELQRDNVQSTLDAITDEYWSTTKLLRTHPFKNRRAQLEAMKHQGRLIAAINALTEARNAVSAIVSELPRKEA